MNCVFTNLLSTWYQSTEMPAESMPTEPTRTTTSTLIAIASQNSLRELRSR
jgi:hypothetical protein